MTPLPKLPDPVGVLSKLSTKLPILQSNPIPQAPVQNQSEDGNKIVKLLHSISNNMDFIKSSAEKVNPVHYLYKATSFLQGKASQETEVTGTSILVAVLTILGWVFFVLSSVITFLIVGMMITIIVIIVFCTFITPFLPILLFISLFYFVGEKVWDIVIVGFLKSIMKAINGITGHWNNFTDKVRSIGFNVPLRIFGRNLGFYVHLGGINLPYAPTLVTEFDSFQSFILKVLNFSIIDPIKKNTKGIIFRE